IPATLPAAAPTLATSSSVICSAAAAPSVLVCWGIAMGCLRRCEMHGPRGPRPRQHVALGWVHRKIGWAGKHDETRAAEAGEQVDIPVAAAAVALLDLPARHRRPAGRRGRESAGVRLPDIPGRLPWRNRRLSVFTRRTMW